jgi:hypothetical protein
VVECGRTVVRSPWRKLRLAVYVFLFVRLWQVMTPDRPRYADGDPDGGAVQLFYGATAFLGSLLAVGILALLVEATLRLVRRVPDEPAE